MLAIARRHGASNVRVFGSVARGTERSDSDIDLLVHVASVAGLLTIERLQRDLEAVLRAPVDVIPDEGLRVSVQTDIDREAVEL